MEKSFKSCFPYLFIVAVIHFFFSGSLAAQPFKEISVQEIIKGTFSARTIQSLPSMKDGKSYISAKRGKLGVYMAQNSYSTGEEINILYKQSDLVYKGDTLELSTDFSDDERKVMLSKDEEKIYRHSVKANYFVFDINSKTIIPVSNAGKQLFATFSPDASKVAFVRENNLFVKDLITGTEHKITKDGQENSIINGRADWVYEEEFSFAKAFAWSADGKKIAFYRFDETEVPEYSMTIFNQLYPAQYTYKYPKAGEQNSRVSIHIYNIETNTIQTVNTGSEQNQYIPRIKWTTSPDVLCVLRMNRHQNKLEYLLADARNDSSKVILTEEDKRYIDVEKERLTFLKNGREFINVSERDGYNHIYLYNLNGNLVKQLTKGNWEVTEVYGIDEVNNTIYYQSTEQSPLNRDVYSIRFDGKKDRISTSAGTNKATFSNDFSYFILSNSTSNTPPLITLNAKGGKLVRKLDDNIRVHQAIKTYGITPTEFFSFKTSENVELNGYMVKPPNFDSAKKYPVLMYVYGGPGHQEVADTWGGFNQMWFQMLAQKGYIIACIDNRGTGFRGAEFKKMTYKHLGKYETIDQIEAAKWLSRQNYVDSSRIGIWGWSYGGYISSLCITKGADIFKTAIAVAPVTTWRFYDTIYTERYLQTPQENPEGYDNNSPINFADLLKGKFLLIHGTADDNVHFQNSVLFSEALIQANKQFEQAYYPNKDHSIYGGTSRIHLYTKMTDFILNNL